MEKKYRNKKTINGYVNDVQNFIEFMEKEGVKIIDVKETNIKKYNINLKERNYSNHTIARKNSSLRLYFKFLRKQGYMVHNPIEDIKQPRLEKKDTKLEDSDIKLIESIMKETNQKRDLLLLYLTYYEKIKISDLIAIKSNDFNEERGILYLKNQALVINEKTKNVINEIKDGLSNDYLFKNNRNEQLTESGAYFVLKKYFKLIQKEALRPIDLSK